MKKFCTFLILSFFGFLPLITYGQVNPGSEDNFVTIWNTQGKNKLTIPTIGEGFLYDLYWEEVDNPSNNGYLLALNGSANIEGLNPETEYRVEISGNFPRIYISNDSSEREKIFEISQWGTIQWASMERAFFGCSNMDVTATDVPDLSGVNSCQSMFEQCSKLVGDEANWDWNTSKVTDMHCMFALASSFDQYIGNWDVSNVTTMSWMFSGAAKFNQDISNWDVSSVTTLEGMFNSASSFNRELGSWDVANVTNIRKLFSGARAFNQDIGSWDVSNVSNMRELFRGARAFDQDIGSWDISGISSMYKMFSAASSFNQDIGNWDVSNVTNFENVFNGAKLFNQDISNWDVSKVFVMTGLLYNASSFNQDLSSWDVSNVSIFNSTFENATSFNQDLSNWDISGVSNMWGMLSGSGMDCYNYSATLIGWADQSQIKDGMYLGAEGLLYGPSAVHAREEILGGKKGWNIRGDAFDECDLVSTSNQDDFHGISVFPNPATNLIRLAGERELGETQLEIYNIAGDRMLSHTVQISPEETIDISELNPGVYIVRITLENAVHALKFLKL